MGIEIRPSRVSAQIVSKQTLLANIKEAALAGKETAYALMGDHSLTGKGYNAAKERVEAYTLLLAGLDQTIELVLETDQKVDSALGRFEGQDMSEDVFVGLRDEAETSIISLDERITSTETSIETCLQQANSQTNLLDVFLSGSYRSMAYQLQCSISGLTTSRNAAQARYDAAAEQLQKIQTYCKETDAVYDKAVKSINQALFNGLGALHTSVWDATLGASVPPLDTTWQGELREAVAQKRFRFRSPEHIYEDGVLDEENCRAMMELPFELWLDTEREAMARAYENMWAAHDMEALERFLCSAYVDGEVGVSEHFLPSRIAEAVSSQVPRYERVLADTFGQFAQYYHQDVESRGLEENEMDTPRLHSGFLLDATAGMSSIWVMRPGIDPTFRIGCIRESDIVTGGSSNISLVTLETDSMKNTNVGGYYNVLTTLTGSGDASFFVNYMRDKEYDKLLDNINSDAINDPVVATALGAISIALRSNPVGAGAVTAAGVIITSLSSGLDEVKRIENNSAIDTLKLLDDTLSILGHDWIEGSVSVVNGVPVLHTPGIDGEELFKQIVVYNEAHDGTDITYEEVVKFLESGEPLTPDIGPVFSFLV